MEPDCFNWASQFVNKMKSRAKWVGKENVSKQVNVHWIEVNRENLKWKIHERQSHRLINE